MNHEKETKQLQEKIKHILQEVNVFPQSNIYYGKQGGDGTLEIDIFKDDNGWHWREIERGSIQKEKITTNEDEIIFWIIKQSIRSKAGEGINWTSRSKHKDPSKIFLNNMINIMSKINSDWAKNMKKEYDK